MQEVQEYRFIHYFFAKIHLWVSIITQAAQRSILTGGTWGL